ncbi:mechanosensitive ion channel family protein [Curtanaerobium respiraculi]|uniref:mechanosensitive ion channel family protein n=1 Tax=Curtanaerobium respiraculi TaxID=2949669 RepID=UPI0024B3C2ED|nr:mechanosensitive ion channel family protein [Curtanaerobium respiraculi]
MTLLSEFQTAYPLLWDLIQAGIILAITGAVEHFVVRVIRRIGSSDNTDLPSSSIFANIARVAIWLAGIGIAAKNCFNYDVTGLVTALGVGGIALSLGLKDTIANLFGGLQISLAHIVEPGDYFEMNGMPAKVTDVTWRHTKLLDAGGTTYTVPNSLMYTEMLVGSGDAGWVSVPVLIAPESDVEAFTSEILRALDEPLAGKVGDLPTGVQLKGMTVGGLSATVNAYVRRDAMSAAAATDLIMRSIDPVLKKYCHLVDSQAIPESI